MESTRSPRSSKHHHSRSRSRSRDRKRERKHRRSRSRSKEARRRDLEKPPKSHKRIEEQQERLLAENGEERTRGKNKRPAKGRSLSRSHSRERRHHSRSREKRHSHSRDKKNKARSRSGSRTKHHHHSRSRSKSSSNRERKKRIEKVRPKSRTASPPVFRGRNTAMDAQEALARRLERAKKLQEQKEKDMFDKQQQQQQEIAAVAAPIAAAAAASTNPALNVVTLLASGTQVTPQIAMAAQMAALQARALAQTGITVPSYYNPSAVNPMKFAEQEKKRKLLWQGKKEGDKSQTAELWEKLNFGNKDQNVKFRKLMGIKGEDDEADVSKPLNDDGIKTLQKQEEMFRNLNVQYEMARSQTHTQRGMGLGFSSSFSRGMDSV
ncbi:arginine/serine-rich coiled-coil protein 2-like [Cynoglossus semilaevis]|uniref:Arginine/serine-rich coiled-coil protein 2 n=1 Tax=Cynoglossus semilaevis TaxID=244447 RepID=A0A3P8W841_CYNSE|nr:arginine/serine-rich coiled-coil protein 2-like [Cynoglossus semilaevis]XP_024908562.1 arginine/serine-rich coiled-coil protein 2-like [Cynoglossus semilaevis]XP_024908563.1 arginine/serine-rich coiled-coil protein 2-like [Cynoglossus semilaevis]